MARMALHGDDRAPVDLSRPAGNGTRCSAGFARIEDERARAPSPSPSTPWLRSEASENRGRGRYSLWTGDSGVAVYWPTTDDAWRVPGARRLDLDCAAVTPPSDASRPARRVHLDPVGERGRRPRGGHRQRRPNGSRTTSGAQAAPPSSSLGVAATRDRRRTCVGGSRLGPDGPLLRALRRATAGPARSVGVPPVRTRGTRRAALRARCGRRQGQYLPCSSRPCGSSRRRALPVNVRFAFDGEEEVGGGSIVEWVDADEGPADDPLILDGGMIRRGQPAFTIGVRGMVYPHLHAARGRPTCTRHVRQRRAQRDARADGGSPRSSPVLMVDLATSSGRRPAARPTSSPTGLGCRRARSSSRHRARPRSHPVPPTSSTHARSPTPRSM